MQIDGSKRFVDVVKYLKGQLRNQAPNLVRQMLSGDVLAEDAAKFVYVGNAFCPSLDEELSVLSKVSRSDVDHERDLASMDCLGVQRLERRLAAQLRGSRDVWMRKEGQRPEG